MNQITVVGNAGKDMEFAYTKNGFAVLKFSIADTQKKGDEKVTTWFNVVCWRERAEKLAEFLNIQKGDTVMVVGNLSMRKEEGKNGEVYVNLDIDITYGGQVQNFGKRNTEGAEGNSSSSNGNGNGARSQGNSKPASGAKKTTNGWGGNGNGGSKYQSAGQQAKTINGKNARQQQMEDSDLPEESVEDGDEIPFDEEPAGKVSKVSPF